MTKRIFAMVLAIALILACLPLTALADGTFYVKTSDGGTLNLRKEPITHANNRIMKIPYGEPVTFIAWVDSTWSFIRYKGKEGFVQTRYLSSTKPGPKPTAKPTAKPTEKPSDTSRSADFNGFTTVSYQAVIEPSTPGGFVHLRWGPSKNYPIMDNMYDGNAVEVIAQNGSWCQVRYVNTGAVGFVMRNFVVVGLGAAS